MKTIFRQTTLLLLLLSTVTTFLNAQDHYHFRKLIRISMPENVLPGTSYSQLTGFQALDTGDFLISGALNGKFNYEGKQLLSMPLTQYGKTVALEIKNGKLVQNYMAPFKKVEKINSTIIIQGKIGQGGIDTLKGENILEINSNDVPIFKKTMHHFKPCGGTEEYCLGEGYIAQLQNNQVKSFSNFSTYGTNFDSYFDKNLSSWISPNSWEYKNDSIYINDTLRHLTSPVWMARFNADGSFNKIIYEPIKYFPNPFNNEIQTNKEMIIGKDIIYTLHQFKDSVIVNSKIIRDSGINFILFAYDLSGNPLWNIKFGTKEYTDLPKLQIDEQDNLILLCQTYKKNSEIEGKPVPDFNDSLGLAYILKINNKGNVSSVWFYPEIGGVTYNLYLNKTTNDIYTFRGKDLYKIDDQGKLYPNALELPKGTVTHGSITSKVYANIIDLSFTDKSVVVLVDLGAGKWHDGFDSLEIKEPEPMKYGDIVYEILSYPNWMFTSIKTIQPKAENSAYYSNNRLYIKGIAENLEIYDVNGKKIKSVKLKSKLEHQEIPVNLAPGIYTYRIYNGKSLLSGKFMNVGY